MIVPVETPAVRSLRCLVVDDEPPVREVIGDILESAGHSVVALGDGAEAIARFAAERFDLVVTDLAMPRVSGWQVARAVKQIAPQAPVFLVTGFGVELSPEERRTHGVDLVLVKPLQIQEMLDAVAEIAARTPQLIVTPTQRRRNPMAYKNLTVERANHVATLTLSRPDAYNALNMPLGRELFEASLELDDDPDVRCIVITGAGRAFCAGGDVKDFVDNLGRIGSHIKELTTYLHGAVSRFCRSDKPVIMAVNGIAAGGGFSFALSGDLVVAAESAKFTMAYSKIAATPDGSSSYFLPRLIGLRRAMELYFTNRVLTAREALEWGLVTRVVPDAELKSTVDRAGRASWPRGRRKPSGRPSACSTSRRGRAWKRRWSWRPRRSPPPAAPRISAPGSPRSPRRRRQRSRADDPAERVSWEAEGAMKPRLYYRPG